MKRQVLVPQATLPEIGGISLNTTFRKRQINACLTIFWPPSGLSMLYNAEIVDQAVFRDE